MPQLIIERVDQPRAWESKFGPMFSCYVHGLLDGKNATGEMTYKQQGGKAPFIGEQTEVSVEQGNYGLKFKRMSSNSFNGGNKGPRLIANESLKYPSFALAYAQQFHANRPKSTFDDVLADATKGLVWLRSNEKPKADTLISQAPSVHPSVSQTPSTPQTDDDGLLAWVEQQGF